MPNLKTEQIDPRSQNSQGVIQIQHQQPDIANAYTCQQGPAGPAPAQLQNLRQISPHYYPQDAYNGNRMNVNPHQEQLYEAPNARLARKIMIAGVTTLVGSSLVGEGAAGANGPADYHSLSANPLIFLLGKSIKLIQLVTFFSCIYFFVQPLISGFLQWKKSNDKKGYSYRSFYLATFIGLIRFFIPDIPNSETQFVSATATNQAPEVFPIDLTSFPTTFCGILFAYIKILNVADCSNWESMKSKHPNLANPVEHTFNKIILLDLILQRSPFIGNLLGFKSRIKFLVNSLLNLSQSSKNSDTHSRITDFIHCDPGFINSRSIVDQLAKILVSLNKTKSSKLTAKELYGDDSEHLGCGYNSVYEYLINTPTNKLNLFELVAVLWCVENVRPRLVNFLGDIVNEGDELNENIEKNIKTLISDIRKIETFVPTPCIKLIKCCNIFKSLLDPKNESYLNDALKMILLSVEENLVLIKQSSDSNKDISEKLLAQLHSSIPVLQKVLIVIHASQDSALIQDKSSSCASTSSSSSSNKTSNVAQPIQLLSDENRLSLLCSIILHQYAIGNVNYGRNLIKYLKGERTRKFMCSDSVSLMASIATFRTIVVVLDNEKRNGSVAEEIYSDDKEVGNKDGGIQSEEDVENGEYEDENDGEDDEGQISDDSSSPSSDMDILFNAATTTRVDYDTSDDSDVDSDALFNERSDSLTFSSEAKSLDSNDLHILEDLLCGLRLYVGQGKIAGAGESTDYDILSLHYGLRSELSHRLLELAKELVGYTE